MRMISEIALAHAGVQEKVQFFPGQHQALSLRRPLAQQRRKHDAVARIGVDQALAAGMSEQAFGGDQQHIGLAPSQRTGLNQRNYVRCLDLAHGQRTEPVLDALEVAPIAHLRALSQAHELLGPVVLDEFPHSPVLCRDGLGFLLVGGRIAALHDLGALDGGDSACVGQADVGVAANRQLTSAATVPVAKDPARQACGR
jgi:hypothetical protein